MEQEKIIEKLMLKLDDMRTRQEKTLIYLENQPLFLGDKDIQKTKSISKLAAIIEIIEFVSNDFTDSVESETE